MNDLSAVPEPRRRKPDWIRVKAPTSPGYAETRKLMRDLNLHTVCEEAACPNIGECWTKKHATVMILGDVCTRACASGGSSDRSNASKSPNSQGLPRGLGTVCGIWNKSKDGRHEEELV